MVRQHDKRLTRAAAGALLAMALGLQGGAVAADGPSFGDVSVFASAPAPGHPFGIAVDHDRVYVSTSAGDFFAGAPELR